MTLLEFAGRLRRHPNTIRRWVQLGVLNPLRMNGRGDLEFGLQDVRDGQRFILTRELGTSKHEAK